MREARKTKAGAAIITLAAMVLFIPFAAMAGDLEPSGPPTTGTMHTLEDIYNKIDSVTCEKALVPKTGQTTSYVTGDDGDLEKGFAWPDPRFTDNGDGTVTDNLTGLIWLRNANCIATNYPEFDNDQTAEDGRVTWQHAMDFVAGINAGTYLDCGGGNTDWRLPNYREMFSLADARYYNPALPNTTGTGKWAEGDPFTNVQSYHYWSGTSFATNTASAWHVHMSYGYVSYSLKTTSHYYVWPVRGGND